MKIIQTVLPLPAAVMVEFFKDKKGYRFLIDYNQSLQNLRTPQAILNYVANLKLEVEFDFEKVPVDLLGAYINMRDVVNNKQLAMAHANTLYFWKYQSVAYEDALQLFDYAEIVEAIKTYTNDLLVQLAFLNSMPLYMATCLNSTKDTDRSKHELVNAIDTDVHKSISVNLFNLFKLDSFLVRFLEVSIPVEQQIYFQPHFDSNMYAGQTLFGWFAIPGNSYFWMWHYLSTKMASGEGRELLLQLHAGFLDDLGDHEGLRTIDTQIQQAGSVSSLLNLTRKDVAEVNRRVRRDKKRAKRATDVQS